MIDYVKFLEEENIENKKHILTLKNPLFLIAGGVFFLFRKKIILNLEKKIKAREEIINIIKALEDIVLDSITNK